MVLAALLSYVAHAQELTMSYGQISCFCPQTGQTIAGSQATYLDFYDGYLRHPLYGKFVATQLNNDGSTTYIPTRSAGTPACEVVAILVSSDYQRMEERIVSTIGNMSLNMINTYTSMGEGRQPAQRWLNANAVASSDYGGSSSSSSSGTCRSCGGTGVSKTPNTGGSRSTWVAYYNSSGTHCPYCNGYSAHFHNRCASCNVPRY